MANVKTEHFSTIIVNEKVSYWIITLSEINWEDLKKHFLKGTFFITTFEKHNLKKNDVILIFQKHSINLKSHGFVAICQIKANIGKNELNINIFKDINMAKFISSISSLELFNEPLKYSKIESMLKKDCKNTNDFCTSAVFGSKYTKQKSVFFQLPNKLGYSLVKNLIALSDGEIEIGSTGSKNISKNEKKGEIFDDPPYSSSEEEVDDEPPYSSDSENSDDSTNDSMYDIANENDVRVVIGHIPILMIPCNLFEWSNDEYVTIKNFKKHFLECENCDKTDNNNCNIYPFVKNSLVHCTDITDENMIDSYLDYYHKEKICKFELVGNDKKNDHIYVFRILAKRHIYHNTILIMW